MATSNPNSPEGKAEAAFAKVSEHESVIAALKQRIAAIEAEFAAIKEAFKK